MQRMGLTPTQLEAFTEAVTASTVVRSVRVFVETLDRELVVEIDPDAIQDGQVDGDTSNETTSRVCQIDVHDPDSALGFDDSDPSLGGAYLDRMLRVEWVVEVPGLDSVHVPLHRGPIVALQRDGEVLSITAHGMEVLAAGEVGSPTFTVKKGERRTAALRRLMRARAGETRMSGVPDLPARFTGPRSWVASDIIWEAANKIVGPTGRQLLYPGTGVLTLRNLPSKPVFRFDADMVLGQVTVEHNADELRNVVIVVGGLIRRTRKKARGSAVATGRHSPKNLGRKLGTGRRVPRRLVERIEDDSIRTNAEAKALAKQRLRQLSVGVSTVSCDVIPVPHLDLGDLVSIRAGGRWLNFRLTKFSVPLVTSGDPVMTIGYSRPTANRVPRKR